MEAPDAPAGRSTTRAPRAMVATPHHLATRAGVRALESGGSAVDAAIAANAVLCVAYPHFAGLGGDGFWLIHDPERGGVEGIAAAGPAARAATREYYLERGHESKPPTRGAAAALTVPGAVDGWRLAHEAHGKLPWRDLFGDAIRYAHDGVPVSRSLAAWLASSADVLQAQPAARRVFADAPLRLDERLVQRDLSRSFEALASEGARDGFYEGPVAQTICAALAPEGSPLDVADFAAFHAEWVDPISTTYRGRVVHEFPPPTQGFAALQILNLLEGFDVGAWGDGSADYYHYAAEAVKVAFADRDEWLTDPRFVDVPLDRLLSKEYADDRRALIRSDSALVMDEVPPGVAFDLDVRRRRAQRADAGGDTCYFCAVDERGLVVSVIESLYHDFGAAVVGGDSGVLMQNRGAAFSLDERHANRLEPGKRTFHTLTPGMVVKDGGVELAFGTMGGEGQPQTHAALLTRIYDFGHDVQQAIDAPRWLMGRTWGRKVRGLSLEARVGDGVLRELARRGQPVRMVADFDEAMGHAQAIRVHRDGGFLAGGADPRGDGAAVGY